MYGMNTGASKGYVDAKAAENAASIANLMQETAAHLADTAQQLELKVNKDEILNGLTAKDGVKTWAQLQAMTEGNTVGDYYYCSDGDGVNPPGNYRWTGSAWSFGGTGDDGYNDIKVDINAAFPVMGSTVFSWTIGKYVSSSGNISNNVATSLTDSIPVSSGEVIINRSALTGENDVETIFYITVYTDGTFIARELIGVGEKYVIPNGINSIRIHFGYSLTSDNISSQEDVDTYFKFQHIKQVALASSIADLKSINAGSYDGGELLSNQSINTFVRVRAEGITDSPINLGAYTGWLMTAGGVNKFQILYQIETKEIYYRYYQASTAKWHDWVRVGGRSLKILNIGNSFNQDVMAYLPPVLNEILPDASITYATLYLSSGTLEDHIDMYNNNTTYTVYNKWKPASTQWSRTSGHTLASVLAEEEWDIITIQGTSSYVTNDVNINTHLITPARTLMRIIQNNVITPVSIMWYQWFGRPYGTYTASEMSQYIIDATLDVMSDVGLNDYIPIAVAVENARTNATLATLGEDGNFIYSDGIHMQAGLPALLSTYTIALKVLEWFGSKHKGIYGVKWKPTAENVLSINASDGEGGGMTHGDPQGVEDNYIRAIQEIAVLAVNKPSVITDCSDIV